MREQDNIVWRWAGESFTIGLDRLGSGPVVLLLPAFSSISTRAEMRALQERLSLQFTAIAIDWPGFGDRARPQFDWRPETYQAFLAHLLSEVIRQPFATVAAGHAAGYLMLQAAAAPGSAGRLCLVAPTWRGPLPTMMGKRLPFFARFGRAGDLPVVGAAFYRLNVNRATVGIMARGHVYADRAWLNEARMSEKMALTRAPGARYASLRFVAGELDPLRSRDEFLSCAARIVDPVLVVCGASTPRKSKAEMEALAALPNIEHVVLATGKLSIHEEYPDAVAVALRPFLATGRD